MVNFDSLQHNKKLQERMAVLLILFFGFGLNYKQFSNYPEGRHAWAQTDYYAMSLGFVKNNLDFFHPQTFHYNHQYPGWWKTAQETTITSADFPIHSYIPAVIMKMTGNHSPLISRMYILFYSFLGLFFLFKLIRLITKDELKAYFVLVIAISSPVFVHYQSAFIPSIPSMANAIIGLWFYFNYRETKMIKKFYWSIFFLILAALARTTFVIPLLAVIGTDFFSWFKDKTNLYKKILSIVMGFGLIVSYLLYNGYLRDKYGSIFLGELMLPDGFDGAADILKGIKEQFLLQYFNPFHYAIMAGLVLFFIVKLFKKKVSVKSPFRLIFMTLMLLGTLAFFIAMMFQFKHHDYYFLDTFFLLVILIIAFLSKSIVFWKKPFAKTIGYAFLGLFILMSISTTTKIKEEIISNEASSITQRTIDNYAQNISWFKELNLPKDARVLSLNYLPPNVPFVFIDRFGYAGMSSDTNDIKSYLDWDYDYLIFQKEFFYDGIYNLYPAILNQVEKVKENNDFILAKYKKNTENQLLNFLGLDKMEPLVTCEFNQKSKAHCFKDYQTELVDSVNRGVLSSENEFGLNFKQEYSSAINWLNLKGNFSLKSLKETFIVVSVTNKEGENKFYLAKNLLEEISEVNQFVEVNLLVKIPKIDLKEASLGVYIWNVSKQKITFDDILLKLI